MTRPVLRRRWVWCVAVLVVYGGLSLFMDPGGTLGTDSGAKVATLAAMDSSGSLRPDLGYWAEDLDPDGVYHPYLDTLPNDRGEWVQVTTLPMLVLARPIAAAGGVRAALVLPMLGALLAALAAADLAGSIGGEAAARRTFWLVALASPVTIYALDFWEHSLGVGFMMLGVACLARVVAGERRWWMPLFGGLAFGIAGSMRSEAYIVGVVAIAIGALSMLSTARLRAVRSAVTAVVGSAVVFVANAGLERWLGGNSRAVRASGRLGAGPLDRLGERLSDAAMTWFGGPIGDTSTAITTGAAFAVAVCAAHVLIARGQPDRARLAMAGGIVVVVLTMLSGPAFIPGALVASPVALAVVGMRRWDPIRRYLLATALISTVLIWGYQILGAAGPQWGGRYLLAPTVLLTLLGSVALDEVPAWMRRAHLGLAVGVTIFGLVWVSQRTHDVARFFDRLETRPEPVLIASDGFLLREGGAAALDERWLSLGHGEPFIGALDLAADSGFDEIGLVSPVAEPPERDGWRPIATTELSLLGSPYFIHTYERIGAK